MELSNDYFHALLNQGHNGDVCANIAQNQALANLDNILRVHGKTLCDFLGLPQINKTQLGFIENTMLTKETMFDATEPLNAALHFEEALN